MPRKLRYLAVGTLAPPVSLGIGILCTGLVLLATRLQDATDLSAVRTSLTGVVTATMEPEHLSVWLADR
jgi:hypothetical protein